MFAAKYGQADLASFLVHDAQANVNVRMRDDSSAFDWAVFGGHRQMMELLAAHPDVDIGATNRFGCAAVQWASASGSISTCKWLQARGVNLGHVNDANHGAVEKAAYRGHDDLLRWLLLAEDGPQLSAQLRIRDGQGRSIADLARLNGQNATAEWLEPLIASEEGQELSPSS